MPIRIQWYGDIFFGFIWLDTLYTYIYLYVPVCATESLHSQWMNDNVSMHTSYLPIRRRIWKFAQRENKNTNKIFVTLKEFHNTHHIHNFICCLMEQFFRRFFFSSFFLLFISIVVSLLGILSTAIWYCYYYYGCSSVIFSFFFGCMTKIQ